MTYYMVCPYCGGKLIKAGDGSFVELNCPKCNEKMIIDVKDDKIIIAKSLVENKKLVLGRIN